MLPGKRCWQSPHGPHLRLRPLNQARPKEAQKRRAHSFGRCSYEDSGPGKGGRELHRRCPMDRVLCEASSRAAWLLPQPPGLGVQRPSKLFRPRAGGAGAPLRPPPAPCEAAASRRPHRARHKLVGEQHTERPTRLQLLPTLQSRETAALQSRSPAGGTRGHSPTARQAAKQEKALA